MDHATRAHNQLCLWVDGQAVHNHEDGECCPDFACCKAELAWDTETRKRFFKAYEAKDSATMEAMMLMALTGVVGDDVHVAGQDLTQH